MRIGIIGAGNIGGTLARRLTALGHEVSVANSRGPESLAELAGETGAKPVTVTQAARAGDVVIVTIPEKNIPQLPPGLFDGVPDDVVVVDTGNYYPHSATAGSTPIEDGTAESRWVSDQLGPAGDQGVQQHLCAAPAGARPARRRARAHRAARGGRRPAGQGRRHPTAGRAGIRRGRRGSLDESWRQQPGTPVYGSDLDTAGVRRALAAATPERQPVFRAAAGNPASAGRA